jgi:hypothetical protein
MKSKRKLKDGWPIYHEWVETENGKRVHWVETDCGGCSTHTVWMPLSKLVANGPKQCDGCDAYRAHTNPY